MAEPKKTVFQGKNPFERYEDDQGNEETDVNTWAVSFSDISTILLSFFILLLSFSVINPNKYEMVQKAVKGASFETTNIKKLEEQIREVVKKAGVEDSVKLTPDELGLNIEILNRVMFESGRASLGRSTEDLLNSFVRQFNQLPKQYKFYIEGHTDDVPISSREFPSNWHLSTARALSVLDIFSRFGIDDKRMRVEGFADTAPIEKYPLKDKNNNPIPENREKNRRVVIKVR